MRNHPTIDRPRPRIHLVCNTCRHLEPEHHAGRCLDGGCGCRWWVPVPVPARRGEHR